MIVDLFAGPGGWDTGLAMIGRRDVVGVEWDESACGESAMRHGRSFIGSDAHKPYCALGVRRIKAAVDHDQTALDFTEATE